MFTIFSDLNAFHDIGPVYVNDTVLCCCFEFDKFLMIWKLISKRILMTELSCLVNRLVTVGMQYGVCKAHIRQYSMEMVCGLFTVLQVS